MADPLEVHHDSAARVALELARQIANYQDAGEARKTPDYWLKLYRQCYLATTGADLAAIRKGD